MKSILKGIIIASVAAPIAVVGTILAINVAGGVVRELSNDSNK